MPPSISQPNAILGRRIQRSPQGGQAGEFEPLNPGPRPEVQYLGDTVVLAAVRLKVARRQPLHCCCMRSYSGSTGPAGPKSWCSFS